MHNDWHTATKCVSDFLIFSVCETNLRTSVDPDSSDSHTDNFPFYNFVGKSRFDSTGIDQARGGTGLFVHNSLHFCDISDKSLEATIISFDYKQLSFVFVSVYLPQKSNKEINLFSAQELSN